MKEYLSEIGLNLGDIIKLADQHPPRPTFFGNLTKGQEIAESIFSEHPCAIGNLK
jgi:hypothetical protein